MSWPQQTQTVLQDIAGNYIPIDSMAQTINMTNGVLSSVTATNGVNTWTQTVTTIAGNQTFSQWVKTQ